MNSAADPSPKLTDHFDRINLADRLAYLEFTDVDRERLREVSAVLNESIDEFVENFYRHLFSFPESARFLLEPALVARLKESQRRHLQSMLCDDVNEDYGAQRRKVGDVHAHLGVEPRLFLGAYNQYLQYGVRQIAKKGGKLPGDAADQISSLLKAVFLDIELTLDAYMAKETHNLRQALDMLFSANTELRQFAQLTSHDLKTPLATVANLCDEAIDEFGEELPAGARSLIEMAKERTFRMSRMIDELLELSAPLDSAEVDCLVDTAQVVAEVTERMARPAAATELKVVFLGDPPRVLGNAARIREAFYNVLSNAAKFADKQPGRVEISVATSEDRCTLAFADNGPGIPADELERIFSPFHRLHKHHDKPGSGLGLYFARSLIEQDGGRVWAESRLGEGSVFFIELKRYK